MPKARSVAEVNLLSAALEGLEAQRQRLEEQIKKVQAMLGARGKGKPAAGATKAPAEASPRGGLSAAGRRRISLAQKRRWAEYRRKVARAA